MPKLPRARIQAHKKAGRKQTSPRRAWREHVAPTLNELTDEERADFYRTEVAAAARDRVRHPPPKHVEPEAAASEYDFLIDPGCRIAEPRHSHTDRLPGAAVECRSQHLVSAHPGQAAPSPKKASGALRPAALNRAAGLPDSW
jgi:hypothetical protein